MMPSLKFVPNCQAFSGYQIKTNQLNPNVMYHTIGKIRQKSIDKLLL